MPSHFSCIGIPLTSTRALEDLAARVIRGKSCEVFGTGQGRYFRHRSASGAELWFQADRRRRLMGANPHFTGRSRLELGLTGWVRRPDDSELDGALHGWVAPEDPDRPDSGAYPLVFDVPDAARHHGLAFPGVEPVQVAAFAHALTCWSDETAYEAAPASLGPRARAEGAEGAASAPLAVRSLVPTGLFVDPGDPPRAEACLTGVVLEADRREHELTGEAFWWLLVESLGGTFDLVADPVVVPEPPGPGAVVHASCWLSGRLIARDQAKRSWLDRIRNR